MSARMTRAVTRDELLARAESLAWPTAGVAGVVLAGEAAWRAWVLRSHAVELEQLAAQLDQCRPPAVAPEPAAPDTATADEPAEVDEGAEAGA